MITGMRKLDALMVAMATHEGWTNPGMAGKTEGSRSYRNHNPGNLRSSIFECANQEGYSIFKNDLIGWCAFHYDLIKKRRGETSSGLTGKSTIRELIFKWAPAADHNVPEQYLQTVLTLSGLAEGTTLDELFI